MSGFVTYMQKALKGTGKVVIYASEGFAPRFKKIASCTLGAATVAFSEGIQTNVANSGVELGEVGMWAAICCRSPWMILAGSASVIPS